MTEEEIKIMHERVKKACEESRELSHTQRLSQ